MEELESVLSTILPFWHMEFNWCIVQFYLYNMCMSSDHDMCCECSYAEKQERHKVITKIVWFKHRWTYGKLQIWQGCNWLVRTISHIQSVWDFPLPISCHTADRSVSTGLVCVTVLGGANDYWGYFVKTKFVSFCNSHFLLHYFSIIDTVSLHEQETLRMDGDILFGLLKKVSPSVYKHLVSTALRIVSFIAIFFVFQSCKTS